VADQTDEGPHHDADEDHRVDRADLAAALGSGEEGQAEVADPGLDGPAVVVEVGPVVVELEEGEAQGLSDGVLDHAVPQRAELLAGDRVDGEALEDPAGQPVLLAAVQLVDDRLLRREVAVDRAGADAGGRGQLGHRGAVEAALDEQGQAGVEDGLALVGPGPGARRRPFGGAGSRPRRHLTE
jgi:hypothetical protein